MNPLSVSVCIPAYKADAFIGKALDSVAAQTFHDWEIIVTEDGSKSRTEEIASEFAKKVVRPVVYNRHERNRGLPDTRNTGIATARGQWISFLDADDFWEPNHLESLINQMKNGPYDLVFAGSKLFDHNKNITVGTRVPTEKQLRSLPRALFTGQLSIMPSSVLIRREAFARYGNISTEFPYVNDTEYWLRILHGGGLIGYSNQITCFYRQHDQSMSNRSVELLEDSARLCERYAKWDAIPRSCKRSRPANLYRWAANVAKSESPQKAYNLLKRSLLADPLNAKTLLGFPRLLALYLPKK